MLHRALAHAHALRALAGEEEGQAADTGDGGHTLKHSRRGSPRTSASKAAERALTLAAQHDGALLEDRAVRQGEAHISYAELGISLRNSRSRSACARSACSLLAESTKGARGSKHLSEGEDGIVGRSGVANEGMYRPR